MKNVQGPFICKIFEKNKKKRNSQGNGTTSFHKRRNISIELHHLFRFHKIRHITERISAASVETGARTVVFPSRNQNVIIEFLCFTFNQQIRCGLAGSLVGGKRRCGGKRSEEHTSELQSQSNLVCLLLL